MLQDSLIICYSTPNYEKLTTHFLNCLDTIWVNKSNICMKRDIPPQEILDEEGFQTNLWYYCLKTKLKHLIDSLILNKNKYNYYISSDCDVQFLHHNMDKWHTLEKYIKKHNKDIYFMREGTSEDVNGGFYIIRNENLDLNIKLLIEVYEEMLITPHSKMPLGEQTIINKKIRGLERIGKIPIDYVIWGLNIYNTNMAIIHHAVCTKGITEKMAQMKKVNDYLE